LLCDAEAGAWMRSRVGHMSSYLCVDCFALLQNVCGAVSIVDAHEYMLRAVEALVQRDLLSGEALDSVGCVWPSIQERRGCRVAFHMDRTSQAAMQACMLAASEEERGQRIVEHLSHARFVTDSAAASETAGVAARVGLDSFEDFVTGALNFEAFAGIGPFKAQFGVYVLSRTTSPLTTSLRCSAFWRSVWSQSGVLDVVSKSSTIAVTMRI